MAITTTGSHVGRASDFYNKDTLYFAIGKTSVWADENNPPIPDPATADVVEIIGYKKVDTKNMVVRDDVNGTIVYRGAKFRIVDPTVATAQGAKWVYVAATLLYDELPLTTYRQVGLYSGLVKANGVSGTKYNLLPADVATRGILEVIDNQKPNPRDLNQKQTLTAVIEF